MGDLVITAHAIKNRDGQLCEQMKRKHLALVTEKTRVRQTLDKMADDELGSVLVPSDFPISNYFVAKTTGDGDCLFYTISMLVAGIETLADSLRILACAELFLCKENLSQHPRFSDVAKETNIDPNLLFGTAISVKEAADYFFTTFDRIGAMELEAKHSCQEKLHCGLLCIFALANVLDRNIWSAYPDIGSKQNYIRKLFNGIIQPLEPKSNLIDISLLWSRDGNLDIGPGEYQPNHFVPIFNLTAAEPTRSSCASDSVESTTQKSTCKY